MWLDFQVSQQGMVFQQVSGWLRRGSFPRVLCRVLPTSHAEARRSLIMKESETYALTTGQAYILAFNKIHVEFLKTLQAQMKRTITALDGHLSSSDPITKPREWLVGTKCTIADLSFVVWAMPQVLDECFTGDEEADTESKRKEKWPDWASWHERIMRVNGVERFLENAEALKSV